MDNNKKFEYLKKIQEKQRKKFLSEENQEKRKEKGIIYKQRLIERQKQKQSQKEYKTKCSLHKFSEKMKVMHEKDAIFYEKIWKKRLHYCENCGKYLGDTFRDIKGNIIVYRYAHIIPKSVYPYLRHYEYNILLLCLNCHTQFDNSPKEIVEKMKCYDKEQIEGLKELHKKLEQEQNNIYK